MLNVTEIATFLGLPKAASISAVRFIDTLEQGLPVSALDRVLRHIGVDVAIKYRIVPKASLSRRKRNHRLSARESQVLARIVRLWVLSRAVWGGDEEARGFLFYQHPLLEDYRPIDLIIDSEFGAEIVMELLGRLNTGTAA